MLTAPGPVPTEPYEVPNAEYNCDPLEIEYSDHEFTSDATENVYEEVGSYGDQNDFTTAPKSVHDSDKETHTSVSAKKYPAYEASFTNNV